MAEAGLYRGTEALDFDGLAILRDPEGCLAAILEAEDRLLGAGAETIILGGAAMAGLAAGMADGRRRIDCLKAGADILAERLIAPTPCDPPLSGLRSSGLSEPLERLLG